jgi:hypothetical protein
MPEPPTSWTPPPRNTRCKHCGDRMANVALWLPHACTNPDGEAPLRPGDPIRVGDLDGTVLRVTSQGATVYLPAACHEGWYQFGQIDRVERAA